MTVKFPTNAKHSVVHGEKPKPMPSGIPPRSSEIGAADRRMTPNHGKVFMRAVYGLIEPYGSR